MDEWKTAVFPASACAISDGFNVPDGEADVARTATSRGGFAADRGTLRTSVAEWKKK
jgi:hypothetical protein